MDYFVEPLDNNIRVSQVENDSSYTVEEILLIRLSGLLSFFFFQM